MKITKFENAYGIKEVNLINIDKLSNVCIYASNGTFKSSFTNAIYNDNTLLSLCQGKILNFLLTFQSII